MTKTSLTIEQEQVLNNLLNKNNIIIEGHEDEYKNNYMLVKIGRGTGYQIGFSMYDDGQIFKVREL